uniref:Trafficking protein particle complex subunit 14 n=1 Tax=Amphiprion percula TaxID=161767 RepID=A0A3P8RN56_AMPPE
MESQCEYFMYFPAVPITDLSDPARYRTLPRRSHLYLGETVRFLLVLRCRDAGATPTEPGPGPGKEAGRISRAWRELAGSLCAVASVSPGESSRHRGNHHQHHPDYQSSGDEANEDSEDNYIAAAEAAIASPLDEPVVLTDEVIFPLTVSLDKLPVSTLKVKVMVTVWKREAEKVEVQELGYLSVLQQREPTHTFRHDLNTFKAQVSTTLTVLPSPTVRCKQMTVSGRQLAVLKVLNESSQEEVSIRDVRILPNLNASYLPMMPDGSVLLVDNVCHQSGEVGMASFCRVDSLACRLPSMLSSLEEHDFLFQLHLNDMPQDDSNEGLEVPLVAVLQWSTPKMPFTNCIYTHYRLPSIRLDRPRFVMTASCPSTVRVKEHFKVKYVLLNNLQDFLAVRLVWTPDGRGQGEDAALAAVVCHTPLSNLGHCRKGSTLSFSVAFQILKPGLYELSQHMKLKLQFTASVSNPPPDARPLSRKNSPSSPAVRDLLDRHQASLGRSQSFSHQQPSRSHIMRTGSAMERRAITPPVGSPVGRPLYLPPQDKTLLSLDKIAKRECKVLVVDPAS